MTKFLTFLILLLPSMTYEEMRENARTFHHVPNRIYEKKTPPVKKEKPTTEFWILVWSDCRYWWKDDCLDEIQNYRIHSSTSELIRGWDDLNGNHKRNRRVFHVDRELKIVPMLQEKYELKEKK